jgi:hypothetical protein
MLLAPLYPPLLRVLDEPIDEDVAEGRLDEDIPLDWRVDGDVVALLVAEVPADCLVEGDVVALFEAEVPADWRVDGDVDALFETEVPPVCRVDARLLL